MASSLPITPHLNSLSLLTFGHRLAAGSGAVSMTTERHQPGDDGRLAEAHVADDHHAPTGRWVVAAETGVHLLEEPLPAGEQPIGREPGDVEVERLQVERRRETNCRRRRRGGEGGGV